MVILNDLQIELARKSEPRAKLVHYDQSTGFIVVELANLCKFSFPVQLIPGLKNATDKEIADVEIVGSGYGLYWRSFDVDLSVTSLLVGHFEIRSQMSNFVEGKTLLQITGSAFTESAQLLDFKPK